MPEHTLLLAALLAAVGAGIVTSALVPPVTKLARLIRALDHPESRKDQKQPIPRLGGVAIVGGAATAALGVSLANWTPLVSRIGRTEMTALGLACGLIFVLGVVDDVFGMSAGKKFAVQAFAAMILVGVGWSFEQLSLPWGAHLLVGPWLGMGLAVLWIVGVTNAVNLIDGLDGLASGVVAIIALSLLTYALLLKNLGTVIVMAAVAGACIGFLRHNWAPAKIFMGDSGSLTLGFLLGGLSVHSSLKAPTAVAILVPMVVLGVPVIDTLLVMFARFLQRPKGRWGARFVRMFVADRNHLHHRLLHLGATRHRAVVTIYLTVFVFCTLAVLVAVTDNWALGLGVLVMEVAVIAAMRYFGFRKEAARIAEKERHALRVYLQAKAAEEDDAAAGDSEGDASRDDSESGPPRPRLRRVK